MMPYYSDKLTTLYLGDCLAVMAGLPAQSFDAVICDPPYGTTACAWDSPIEFAAMWKELKRLIKPRAPVVLFGQEPFSSLLRTSDLENYSYDWVWKKSRASGFLDANRKPLRIHENIMVFASGYTTYNPQKEPCARRFKAPGGRASQYNGGFVRRPLQAYDDRYPTSVLAIGSEAAALGLHPTQKPLALMEYLVKTYTNEGARVLDFTAGSGTTLRACKNLKRESVGIEQEERYCAVTARRLSPVFEEALQVEEVADMGPLFMELTL